MIESTVSIPTDCCHQFLPSLRPLPLTSGRVCQASSSDSIWLSRPSPSGQQELIEEVIEGLAQRHGSCLADVSAFYAEESLVGDRVQHAEKKVAVVKHRTNSTCKNLRGTGAKWCNTTESRKVTHVDEECHSNRQKTSNAESIN